MAQEERSREMPHLSLIHIYNPRTGEEINIAAAAMPVFKPGKVLKDKVDGNK